MALGDPPQDFFGDALDSIFQPNPLWETLMKKIRHPYVTEHGDSEAARTMDALGGFDE